MTEMGNACGLEDGSSNLQPASDELRLLRAEGKCDVPALAKRSNGQIYHLKETRAGLAYYQNAIQVT
ncbi:hypothetical protein VTK73DRAFT_8136 [Phialemonium thermophilum]|uniref:Uncharacterized protein n=1 Tax=Phialemonium thermophilum TaxID=223376 RepID=A0ABR3XQT9_9PEZI